LGYDKFEQRVFLHYGNGVKTAYSYEEDRRRLKHMTASTAAKRSFIDNEYAYDRVNTANATAYVVCCSRGNFA
jgi:hypothetical protein